MHAGNLQARRPDGLRRYRSEGRLKCLGIDDELDASVLGSASRALIVATREIRSMGDDGQLLNRQGIAAHQLIDHDLGLRRRELIGRG